MYKSFFSFWVYTVYVHNTKLRDKQCLREYDNRLLKPKVCAIAQALVADSPSRKLGFHLGPNQAGFVMDKVALGQVSFQYIIVARRMEFPDIPIEANIISLHVRPSSGRIFDNAKIWTVTHDSLSLNFKQRRWVSIPLFGMCPPGP
jgi:hypothetical protein